MTHYLKVPAEPHGLNEALLLNDKLHDNAQANAVRSPNRSMTKEVVDVTQEAARVMLAHLLSPEYKVKVRKLTTDQMNGK